MTEHVPPDWYDEFFTELPNEPIREERALA